MQFEEERREGNKEKRSYLGCACSPLLSIFIWCCLGRSKIRAAHGNLLLGKDEQDPEAPPWKKDRSRCLPASVSGKVHQAARRGGVAARRKEEAAQRRRGTRAAAGGVGRGEVEGDEDALPARPPLPCLARPPLPFPAAAVPATAARPPAAALPGLAGPPLPGRVSRPGR